MCIVHRPLYDDWTLPKGKLENGESNEQAALREVAEEAGVAGRLVETWSCETRYLDYRGRDKVVTYFLLEVDEVAFSPNDEVDRLEWLPPAIASARLTYPHDAEVLNSLLAHL